MLAQHKTIYYSSRYDVLKLYHFTDQHVGAKAHAEALWRRDIETVANDPNAYWTHGGDGIDAICHIGDKRYDPRTLAPWVWGEQDVMSAQLKRLLEDMSPIAPKCLAAIGGNHEADADRRYGRELHWDTCVGLAQMAANGTEPEHLALGYQGFLVITFRRGTPESYVETWTITVYMSHGYGGGRLPGGHALALGRVLGDYTCDLALMGHRHTLEVTSKIVTSADGRQQHRLAAFVPSYLNAYIQPSDNKKPIDSYVEGKGLPPQPLGSFPILLFPEEQRFALMVSNQPGALDFQAWATESIHREGAG